MNGTKKEQEEAIHYYDKISTIYDFISNWYYKKPRKYAIEKLKLKKDQVVLNLPCGTGVNFKYFQHYLKNSGLILGIDLSDGMLKQAEQKIDKNDWTNIDLQLENAIMVDQKWVNEYSNGKRIEKFDAVFCDLGLSGLPDWKNIIDNMISILKPGGSIVILDWYVEKPGLLGKFIKWIGKGEVKRPLWQYLQSKIFDFELKWFGVFNGVFVASGVKAPK
ncbi:MAG: 16S rRNA (cytosine(1402)-N(4))-methyltransferase [Flavobacteriales bacterium]|nr:16S rRNA (cytosine(1402)-N(4))-methyltransferase [Flavobacteriales bacterium]|tara:strand:- start:357 stop:1013 length:657 start_codon:yes stop_codon:yes gene_type:complete